MRTSSSVSKTELRTSRTSPKEPNTELRTLFVPTLADGEGGAAAKMEERPLFGANIPFDVNFREIKVTDEEFKNIARPDPGSKFHLKNEINFEFRDEETSK